MAYLISSSYKRCKLVYQTVPHRPSKLNPKKSIKEKKKENNQEKEKEKERTFIYDEDLSTHPFACGLAIPFNLTEEDIFGFEGESNTSERMDGGPANRTGGHPRRGRDGHRVRPIGIRALQRGYDVL
jgi:hypothetical protein